MITSNTGGPYLRPLAVDIFESAESFSCLNGWRNKEAGSVAADTDDDADVAYDVGP